MSIIHPCTNSNTTASNKNNLIVSRPPSQRAGGIQIKDTFQRNKHILFYVKRSHTQKKFGNNWECKTVNKKGEMKINIQERGGYRKI